MITPELLDAERRLACHPVGRRSTDAWLVVAWLAESLVCVAAWPAAAPDAERWVIGAALLGAQFFNFALAWRYAGGGDPSRQTVKQVCEAAMCAASVAKCGLLLVARAGPAFWAMPVLLTLCGLAWAIESVSAAHRAGRHPCAHFLRLVPGNPRPAPATYWESSWRFDTALAPACVACVIGGWPAGVLAAGDAFLSGLFMVLALALAAVWWLSMLRLCVTLLYRAGLNARLAVQGELR